MRTETLMIKKCDGWGRTYIDIVHKVKGQKLVLIIKKFTWIPDFSKVESIQYVN